MTSSAHAEALWCEGHPSQRAFDRAVLGRAGTKFSGEDGCVLESPRLLLLQALCGLQLYIQNLTHDPPLSFAPRSCNIFQCCSLLSFPSPWITSRVTSCKTWENEGASESSASANTTATYRLNVLLFWCSNKKPQIMPCWVDALPTCSIRTCVRCWVRFCELVLEIMIRFNVVKYVRPNQVEPILWHDFACH